MRPSDRRSPPASTPIANIPAQPEQRAPKTKATPASPENKTPMTSRRHSADSTEVPGPEGFSVANLRAAALRLLMLATSFEHRLAGSRDPMAERQICRVLKIIKPHVKANADAETRARVARLSMQVASFYELYRRDPEFDGNALNTAMKNLLEISGYLATTDALDELVPGEQEIRDEGGPQEAADIRLGAVLGVSAKSIENWRLSKVPVGTHAPFNVQVGPLNIVRHVVEMLLEQYLVRQPDLENVNTFLGELIEAKHAAVAPALSRLSALSGRNAAKEEL